jgi:hypothetical protein
VVIAISYQLRDVPVKEVVLFAAGRAKGANPAAEQQGRANSDEYGRQIRFQVREPMSNDGKISG